MHMIDWNGSRQQIVAGVGEIGKLSSDAVRGYMALSGAGTKTDQLDIKTRELVALAVAVSLRCDGCITVHAEEAARKLGVTRQDMAEALGIPVSIDAAQRSSTPPAPWTPSQPRRKRDRQTEHVARRIHTLILCVLIHQPRGR